MATAASGARAALTDIASDRIELALEADALWVSTASPEASGTGGNLARLARAGDAPAHRHRGRTHDEDWRRDGAAATRRDGHPADGGDAETGTGIDVGAGLAVTDGHSGLGIELLVRRLIAHQAEGFEENGFAVSMVYDPSPTTRLGLRAAVAPIGGAA